MRVASRGYRNGVRSLEVMVESLSGGSRPEIKKDGRFMELKIFCLAQVFSVVVERGKLGEAKCDLIRHADCSVDESMIQSARC